MLQPKITFDLFTRYRRGRPVRSMNNQNNDGLQQLFLVLFLLGKPKQTQN